MQFVDVAKIRIEAGNGGNGSVSFHREKYVASGGPDGGDGGNGGSVLFVADDNLSTLMDFRYKRKYAAQPGENGGAAKCSGKNAPNLVIKVPRGTLVLDDKTGLVIADVSGDEPVVIAKGGRGGWGNTHFATPTRQIPRFAKPGLPGQALDIRLELKLIADVGLIGFPNVGKSTLISVLSAAKPKIANYHFTTLSPVLGVVRVDAEQSFVAADIPGLIEGAAEGAGLGHDFLRHVERCRLLLHVVDVSGSEGRSPIEDFEKINAELSSFSPKLSARPQIVLGNKCDIATAGQIEEFKTYIENKGLVFRPVSAAAHTGIQELPRLVYNALQTLPPPVVYQPEFVPDNQPKPEPRAFAVAKLEDGSYTVDAPWLERILEGSDMDDYESLQYFQRQLETSGVLEELQRQGVEEEDTIRIGEFEFDYIF
ncbi:MAG: GTPase ObgE [Oscillospiraceae bacterium]